MAVGVHEGHAALRRLRQLLDLRVARTEVREERVSDLKQTYHLCCRW